MDAKRQKMASRVPQCETSPISCQSQQDVVCLPIGVHRDKKLYWLGPLAIQTFLPDFPSGLTWWRGQRMVASQGSSLRARPDIQSKKTSNAQASGIPLRAGIG